MNGKRGPPEEYEFKMTRKEMEAANEGRLSARQKIAVARELFAEYRRLRPQIKKRDLRALLTELLTHPKLALHVDALFPHFLPEFFREKLFAEETREALAARRLELKPVSEEAAPRVGELLENEWKTPGDLREGIASLVGLHGASSGELPPPVRAKDSPRARPP